MRRLIKNTGVVFGAINEREGALGQLIVNSNNTFEATASRDEALAETFQVFPTFLDESKATLARLERFANNTRPLVNDLKGPADDLGPDGARPRRPGAGPATRLFRDLTPLIQRSRTGLPDLERILRGGRAAVRGGARVPPRAEPDPVPPQLPPGDRRGLHHQRQRRTSPATPAAQRYQTQIGIDRPALVPEATRSGPTASAATPTSRRTPCSAPSRSARSRASTASPRAASSATRWTTRRPARTPRPPCFVQPPSLYNGKQFNLLQKGKAPNRTRPASARAASPRSTRTRATRRSSRSPQLDARSIPQMGHIKVSS